MRIERVYAPPKHDRYKNSAVSCQDVGLTGNVRNDRPAAFRVTPSFHIGTEFRHSARPAGQCPA